MLNAEDTKERIRKLRLKVISEPLVSGSTGDLDQQIANTNELQKDLEIKPDLKDIDKNFNIGDDKNFSIENTNIDLKKYSNKFEGLSQNFGKSVSSSSSEVNSQNEIDQRIKNNSKIIIDLFNDKVENLKTQIVKNENLEKFRNNITLIIEKSIIDLSSKLNVKLNDIYQDISRKETNLDKSIKDNSFKLEKRINNDFSTIKENQKILETNFSKFLRELEEKIYIDIERLIKEFTTQMKIETDKNILNNEVTKSDFFKKIENFEEFINKQINEVISKSNADLKYYSNELKNKFDTLFTDIEDYKSQNSEQLNSFNNSQAFLKKEFDDFKDSIALKSDALASEISFQIEDFNNKFVEQLTNFNTEIENTKNILDTSNKQLSEEFEKKIDKIRSDNEGSLSQVYDETKKLKNHLNSSITKSNENFEIKINKIQSDNENIISQVQDETKNLTTELSSRIAKSDENLIELISNAKREFKDKLDIKSKEIDEINSQIKLNAEIKNNDINDLRSQLEKTIDDKNKITLSQINKVDDEHQKRCNDLKNNIEKSNSSNLNQLKEEIKTLKVFSEDIFTKSKIDINRVEKSFSEKQKIIYSDISNKENEIKEFISKHLDDIKIHYDNISSKLENDNQIKLNNFLANFNSEMLGAKNVYELKFNSLNKILSDIKISFDEKFEAICNDLKIVDKDLKDCRQEIKDNRKELELKISDSQKSIIGLFKEKYKTLKSRIWEELSLIKTAKNNNLEKIGKIENLMVTVPTLRSSLKSEIKLENKNIKSKINNEIYKINQIIKNLDDRILGEKELTELFQNHTLNVNISKNNKLLSKEKKEYENKNSFINYFKNKN